MANSTSVKIQVENVWAASTVVAQVTHKITDVHNTTEAENSVVAQFTGTGSNTLSVGSAGAIYVGAVQQTNPISHANLDWDSTLGFMILVEREGDVNDAGDDPTGSVTLAADDFGGITFAALAAGEGDSFAFFRATGVAAVLDNLITVDLTGTTGYKVSVIAFGLTT